MSSGKTWLIKGQKEQALIRWPEFYAVSDQSQVFVIYEHLEKKTFLAFCTIKKPDLGKPHLLQHKPDFPR